VADLRLCISLSGGASLGAYQAGATAALLTAIAHLRDEEGLDVRLDAVGGASAGAIVAMMAAHAVLEGLDGADVMRSAWVDRVSIDKLLRRGSRGPLSLEEVRKELPDLLDGAKSAHGHQEHPVMLHISLTGLRGLTYEIPGLRGDEPLLGVTYADWRDFRLEPGKGIRQLLEPSGASPLETVMASASHPGAFAPRVLDRTADTDDYEAQGLSNLPKSGWLWYTDGGLVQHEPIGRLLVSAREVDDAGDDSARLTLMVHPRSKEPTDSEEWSDRDHAASWAEGLSRGLAVVSEQPLYDDLRKVQRDNSRLERAEELVKALEPHLDDGAREPLRELLGGIAEQRRELRGGDDDELDDLPGDDAGTGELLSRAVHDVSGLGSKRRQTVDLISPLLIAARADENVSDLLAGELMGDFGGFLDRDLRESDFALGYESTLCWAQEGLERCGLPSDAASAAVEAIERARPVAWEEVRKGRSTERDLPWRARLRLAHFLLRMVRALVR
jgi:predicted acylesterase/phospholipase RssA